MSPNRINHRERLGLIVMLVGAFLSSLDFTIMNVAVPAIQADLHASFATMQLIVAGYGVAYGANLIVGGGIGDVHGRKRVYLLAVAGFGMASALCGIAPNPFILGTGRVLQGVAAAAMFPQVLAYIQATFTGVLRGHAFAAFGITLGLGSISGNLLSGVLVEANLFNTSWRPIFLINVPVVIVTLIAGRVALDESSIRNASKPDATGAVLLAVALTLFVTPLTIGREFGWPVWTVVSLGLGFAAIGAFFFWQRWQIQREATHLVDLTLFALPSFSYGLLTATVFWLGLAAILVVLTYYAQLGLGLSPSRTGLMFAPFAASFVMASLATPRLIARFGARLQTVGMALMAVALGAVVWLVLASKGAAAAPTLTLLLAVYGFGQGLTQSPLIASILAGVPEHSSGAASGVISTVQQLAYVLGIAVIASVFFAHIESTAAPDYRRALVAALTVNFSLLILAAFVSLFKQADGTPSTSNASLSE